MDDKESAMRSVLIVDPDFGYADSLAPLLRGRGYETCYAESGEHALALLRGLSSGAALPAVALIEVGLGGRVCGVDLIPRLHLEHPQIVCVLMGAGIDGRTAIDALRRGAFDYIEKSDVEKSDGADALFAVLDRSFDHVDFHRRREAAIDALRRDKEAAEAASRGKSGFLATMSHELRTPLNAIIGFSEMMMQEVRGPLGNDQYRAYTADIHESGTHLLQIINDILDISKAEAGKLELNEEIFDLADTIRSVRNLANGRLRDGGLSDGLDLAADLPLLRADERKTKQVLLNLVINAVKFTPPGGHISIAGRFDPAAGLTVTVTDTGVGIAPEDIGRVLQPFEQVNSEMSVSQQGTGLGLPLVKAIMELHGGRFELRSEVGTGTQVSITFPPQLAVFDPNDESEGERDAA